MTWRAPHVPAWKIAAAVTALRREFPRRDVSRVFPPRGAVECFVVWRRGGLRVSPELFHRCADEAAVEAAIAKAAAWMGEGCVLEVA